jgi:phage-related protein
MGTALSVAQIGGKHPAAKPWKGTGSGVLEIIQNHDGNTYRGIYTVHFHQAVYVLHCFQKNRTRALRHHGQNVELVAERLKLARADYEDRYVKNKPRA